MKALFNGTRFVIHHGAKAHLIQDCKPGLVLVTFCGWELHQHRPALSRDRRCLGCARALRNYRKRLREYVRRYISREGGAS